MPWSSGSARSSRTTAGSPSGRSTGTNPVRVVLDPRARAPRDSQLLRSRRRPRSGWSLTTVDRPPAAPSAHVDVLSFRSTTPTTDSRLRMSSTPWPRVGWAGAGRGRRRDGVALPGGGFLDRLFVTTARSSSATASPGCVSTAGTGWPTRFARPLDFVLGDDVCAELDLAATRSTPARSAPACRCDPVVATLAHAATSSLGSARARPGSRSVPALQTFCAPRPRGRAARPKRRIDQSSGTASPTRPRHREAPRVRAAPSTPVDPSASAAHRHSPPPGYRVPAPRSRPARRPPPVREAVPRSAPATPGPEPVRRRSRSVPPVRRRPRLSRRRRRTPDRDRPTRPAEHATAAVDSRLRARPHRSWSLWGSKAATCTSNGGSNPPRPGARPPPARDSDRGQSVASAQSAADHALVATTRLAACRAWPSSSSSSRARCCGASRIPDQRHVHQDGGAAIVATRPVTDRRADRPPAPVPALVRRTISASEVSWLAAARRRPPDQRCRSARASARS